MVIKFVCSKDERKNKLIKIQLRIFWEYFTRATPHNSLRFFRFIKVLWMQHTHTQRQRETVEKQIHKFYLVISRDSIHLIVLICCRSCANTKHIYELQNRIQSSRRLALSFSSRWRWLSFQQWEMHVNFANQTHSVSGARAAKKVMRFN